MHSPCHSRLCGNDKESATERDERGLREFVQQEGGRMISSENRTSLASESFIRQSRPDAAEVFYRKMQGIRVAASAASLPWFFS